MVPTGCGAGEQWCNERHWHLLCSGCSCGAGQDYDEAFKWFKRAAEDETYAGGLYNLARCYREGLGTRKNEAEADRLTALADELEQNDCLVSEVEDSEE